MKISKETVAEKIGAYLRHELTLDQLVDWSERALMDGRFGREEAPALARAVARLGVADVRAFGLSWDDCEEVLHELGYSAKVKLVPA